MEGDCDHCTGAVDQKHFYPRPHMEGDLFHPLHILPSTNFYPRPHMEGDLLVFEAFNKAKISTHALTWRATPIKRDARFIYSISTHALTWRATVSVKSNARRGRHFYPRPHMEGDLEYLPAGEQFQDFYPRPHMEGD